MTRDACQVLGRFGWLPFAAAILVVGTPVVALPNEASSAPNEPIMTDRPTDSASPVLVPRKMLQIELGYKFTRLDTESGRTDTQELPDLLARFGISDAVEARLTATGWSFEKSARHRLMVLRLALRAKRGREIEPVLGTKP